VEQLVLFPLFPARLGIDADEASALVRLQIDQLIKWDNDALRVKGSTIDLVRFFGLLDKAAGVFPVVTR
jgi:hypothetical protein